MPSKSNERFLRADRRNKLEKVRLEQTLRTYDRERSFKAHEIDREKKNVVKSFESVRRTSGISDQGVQPKNVKDTDFLNEPVYRMGLRISERRLMEWRNQEKELERTKKYSNSVSRLYSQCYFEKDENGNETNDRFTQSYYSIGSDDDVFYQNETTENMTFDPQKITEDILEEYKSIFKTANFKINKAELRRIQSGRFSRSYSEFENKVMKDKLLRRPHTANITSQTKKRSQSFDIPPRPLTASHFNRKSSLQNDKHHLSNGVLSKNEEDQNVSHDPGSHINQNENEKVKNTGSVKDKSISGISNTTVIDIVSKENVQNMLKTEVDEHAEKDVSDKIASDFNDECNSKGTIECVTSNNIPEVKYERKRQRKVSSAKFHDMKTDTIPEDEELSTLNENGINASSSEKEITNYKNNRRVVVSEKPRRIKQSVYTIPEGQTSEQPIISDNMSEISRVTDDVSSQTSRARSSKGRQRRVSISTVSSDRQSTMYGSVFGSISDLSVDSNGQRRPSRWREFVAADNAPIPETKKMVSVTTVVRAALAFSKNARKRALSKLVEEQSADAGQIIREERLRRLHSRNDILTAIANNWTISNEAAGSSNNLNVE